MFRREIKNKDMIVTISISLIIAVIGWKLLEYVPETFVVIDKIYGLLVPFIYAFVIAYILNPIVKLFTKRLKLNQGIAIAITYLLFLGGIVIFAFVAIPNLYQSVTDLISKMPEYIKDAQNFFYETIEQQNVKEFINSTGLTSNIEQMIVHFGEVAVKMLEGTVNTAFSLTTSVINVALGMLISIYVLCDKDRFKREGRRFLVAVIKEQKTEKIIGFIKTFHNMIGTYIGIKAIDSSIIALMAFVLLSLVKSEYALFLSVIVGVTNMIPYFGPFIGEIIGFLFNVFVSPTKAIIVFVVLFSLQMFDGWYLDPKLIGSKVGVRPFWIILAVVIGGGFYGPIGMLLASPAVATIKIYYDKFIDKREQEALREKEALENIEQV